MLHFVSFFWDAQDSEAGSTVERMGRSLGLRQGWSCIFAEDGMRAYAALGNGKEFRHYLFSNRRGVIIGRLFPRKFDDWQPSWQPELDDSVADSVAKGSGQLLTDRYWGSYVALIRDPSLQLNCIFRDASGRIPCHRTCCNRVHIAFADVTDTLPCNLSKYTINEEYLAAFIYSSQLQIRASGFREVCEILAGECFEVRSGQIRQYNLWDPRTVCRGSSHEDYDEACSALRSTTQRSIDAWASIYGSILHSLSGGLDSSIVLGCLRRSPSQPSITCVHSFSSNPGDDESHFARRAAAMANVPLEEVERDAEGGLIDPTLVLAPKLVKPVIASIFSILELPWMNRIAAESAADIRWTGQGGDHLFLATPTDLGAADYLARRGFRRGLFSAIRDSAVITGQPYLSVLITALRTARSRLAWRPKFALNLSTEFVNRDALPKQLLSYISHPWIEGCEDLPKGKQEQIFSLAEVLNRHRPVPSLEYCHEHHPLLSQPIVELALRIPTYQLLRGGRQRALARDAFVNCVPREILAREDKGNTTDYGMNTFHRNRPYFRELLLGGLLAKHRLLNPKPLELYLSGKTTILAGQLFPLFACIAAEIWCRSWSATEAG